MQLCPLKLFYIVYNPSRLRHFVPEKTSLSYITYRKLIKKHRHRHLKRLSHDQDDKEQSVPAVPSVTVSEEHQDRLCSVAEDSIPTAAVAVAATSSSSSSVKDPAPVNSCTAVISRSSFSIMRLLSLPEADSSGGADVRVGADAGDDVRKLSAAVGHNPAEIVTSQDQSATAGSLRDSGSVQCAEIKPVPVHFKKRMLNTATVSQPPTPITEPTVIGRSVTPRLQSIDIYQDESPTKSTPPAKVGIVISHGRAMTLQDKLQMNTNSTRRSPTSSGRSSIAASPLQVLNRHVTPRASQYKLKRHQKAVVKRSLMPSQKVRFFLLFKKDGVCPLTL